MKRKKQKQKETRSVLTAKESKKVIYKTRGKQIQKKLQNFLHVLAFFFESLQGVSANWTSIMILKPFLDTIFVKDVSALSSHSTD
jgi:hypothetical protein